MTRDRYADAHARRLPPGQPPHAGGSRRGIICSSNSIPCSADMLAAPRRASVDHASNCRFEPEAGAYGGGHKHGHDETFAEDYAAAQAVFHEHHGHELARSTTMATKATTTRTTTATSHDHCSHDHGIIATRTITAPCPPLNSLRCCISRRRRCRSAAFSYSQGLEAAIELRAGAPTPPRAERLDRDNLDARAQAHGEAAGLARCIKWSAGARATLTALAQRERLDSTPARESAELRRETEQMGWSLRKLSAPARMGAMQRGARRLPRLRPRRASPPAFAFAAFAHDASASMPRSPRYAFSWVENQAAAAIEGGAARQRRAASASSSRCADRSTRAAARARSPTPPRPHQHFRAAARHSVGASRVAVFAALSLLKDPSEPPQHFRSLFRPQRRNCRRCAWASAAPSAPARPRCSEMLCKAMRDQATTSSRSPTTSTRRKTSAC